MSDRAAAGARVLRVLVVDDEPLGRRRVLDLLDDAEGVEVVGTAADGASAVEAIRTTRPDLVFLDVQMPRMSGLEVVQAVGPGEMPATIFVTAYDQYALNAFDSAAVDYLVKPFKDDRFEEALRRARRRIESESRERLHEQLMALLQGRPITTSESSPPAESAASPTVKHLERIAVQMRGKMRVVPVSQIDYVTASGQYVELHVGTHRYIIRESLQHLEERLDPEYFVRVHRSAIVRLSLVDTLLRSEGSDYQVQLKGGVRLPVGRSRREALERRLGRTS
ncbi:MAG: LytR/AlgR family response regulator transcription factor [Gemmatimonadaceae bacterium]